MVRALTSEGVSVCAVDDSTTPAKPDAVFPNNWLSFHEDGTLVLYPDAEREPQGRAAPGSDRGRACASLISRSRASSTSRTTRAQGQFLEGTGSLVLDHVERVAYAALSPRTHRGVLAAWAQELGTRR